MHVEPLSPEHYGNPPSNKIVFTFINQYFQERHNKLVVNVTETVASFKRRVRWKANGSAEAKENKKEKEKTKIGVSSNPADWNTHCIGFTVVTNKGHTFKQLKDIISSHINIQPQRIRVYDKESHDYEEGRLLKDQNAKLGSLFQRSNSSKISTELAIEILDEPEDLRKVLLNQSFSKQR